MLMITYQKADHGVVLKLEGRLTGPWSEELASFWAQTVPRLLRQKLSIDLRDLTYADFRGRDVLRTIYPQTHPDLITRSPLTRHLADEIRSGGKNHSEKEVVEFSGKFRSLLDLPGKFFNKLSPETFNTLMWMVCPVRCAAGEVLFQEDDLQMESVYLVIDGKVKLSISAPGGRKVTCTVAKKGDILGLASVLSGAPSEMTAETIERSSIARIWKQDFSHFLMNHPDAYEAVIKEVREDLHSAMQLRRTIGSDESEYIEYALRKPGGNASGSLRMGRLAGKTNEPRRAAGNGAPGMLSRVTWDSGQ
jgi:CRP-like cAMP-binding protein